jgi:ribonucleoside-diphosphate reductase alpha chain
MNVASGAKMTKVSEKEMSEATSFDRKVVPLGLNARRVIAKRYSLKDAKGNSLEEWSDIVARVVAHVSVAETDPAQRDLFFNGERDQQAREFVPNTPCLVNAGKAKWPARRPFLADVPDSIAAS